MVDKFCTKCGIKKPLSGFYNSKKSKDGKMSACIHCSKERRKSYYQMNKEESKRKALEWVSSNKECCGSVKLLF